MINKEIKKIVAMFAGLIVGIFIYNGVNLLLSGNFAFNDLLNNSLIVISGYTMTIVAAYFTYRGVLDSKW